MVKIKTLVWDKWNEEHLGKHKVKREEIKEICKGVLKSQPTYSNRIIIFGCTVRGRKLAVVLAKKRPSIYYVVTARDASKKERRRFYK